MGMITPTNAMVKSSERESADEFSPGTSIALLVRLRVLLVWGGLLGLAYVCVALTRCDSPTQHRRLTPLWDALMDFQPEAFDGPAHELLQLFDRHTKAPARWTC